ncbi:HPP family protein [Allokutzneria sp. NRRL B-24872]|uniref:HPP family protein n=1 Tax=Allokutzneria sp. NRRL B-24872 TaxID=1137961 RepID=UPI001FEDBD9C|nr:HPP family protein [Allokutzneria sp. NRRL B-24872]
MAAQVKAQSLKALSLKALSSKALYCGAASFVAIAVIAVLAMATGEPLLFPSLGPTAFLIFTRPAPPTASPRNTVLGHLIGVGAGWLGLAVCGLLNTPPDLAHADWARVGAAAIALGLTCGLMPLLGVPHPPAGATTLIVALGLLRTPEQLAVLMTGVVLITLLGVVINRLAAGSSPGSSAEGRPERRSGVRASRRTR